MSKERWEQWYPDDKEPPTPTPGGDGKCQLAKLTITCLCCL